RPLQARARRQLALARSSRSRPAAVRRMRAASADYLIRIRLMALLSVTAIRTVDVLAEHSRGAESRSQATQRGTHPGEPSWRQATLVALVEGGQDPACEHLVEDGRVALVLGIRVLVLI